MATPGSPGLGDAFANLNVDSPDVAQDAPVAQAAEFPAIVAMLQRGDGEDAVVLEAVTRIRKALSTGPALSLCCVCAIVR